MDRSSRDKLPDRSPLPPRQGGFKTLGVFEGVVLPVVFRKAEERTMQRVHSDWVGPTCRCRRRWTFGQCETPPWPDATLVFGSLAQLCFRWGGRLRKENSGFSKLLERHLFPHGDSVKMLAQGSLDLFFDAGPHPEYSSNSSSSAL